MILRFGRRTRMQEEEVKEMEFIPYMDTIRHVNQFGTPETPIMEIDCVPDKVATVRVFMEHNNIELWSADLNPLVEHSTDPADTSQ